MTCAGCSVTLDSGEVIACRVLVGADGCYSKVQLLPEVLKDRLSCNGRGKSFFFAISLHADPLQRCQAFPVHQDSNNCTAVYEELQDSTLGTSKSFLNKLLSGCRQQV